ncbi:DUF3089 domain-containing protein [Sphingomonas swuensis]|uniref:DUF3089 domain-containing protein n=1 Tax=Sphingomonas swuensis TaxID=977800 RepID=A0ABP7SZ49_9SPHN
MCARRFLLVIFFLTLLVVGGSFAIWQYGQRFIARSVALPTVEFKAPPAASGPDYVRIENWLNLPDTVPPGPASWQPKGYVPQAIALRPAATFYIHPTTYLQRDRWNAPLGDKESQDRARLFVRSQGSAFGQTSVYAPKYRQAAFGAFLDTGEDATKALDLAYSDVARAFDRFLSQVPDGPIVLAGHSQGGLHLTRLLRERIARDPALARRIVAAYVIGWPVSVAADIPAMGLPACTRADQAGCILSWQSFKDPANTDLITGVYNGSTGFNGQPRRREDMLCVNPVTGTAAASRPDQSAGTTVPTDQNLADATFTPGQVGARCERGFLMIDGPDNKLPDLGPYVLPGNNYHVYDVALFWGDVRLDLARRLGAWRP